MARKRTSSFEDIVVVIARLPWWIGVGLALVFYVWLHHVATEPAQASPTDLKQMGTFVTGQIWVNFASFLQFILPIACLFGAGISAYKKSGKEADQDIKGSEERTIRAPQQRKARQERASSVAQNSCPVCGAQMIKRIAKKGSNAGEAFWGCSNFPQCRGTRK